MANEKMKKNRRSGGDRRYGAEVGGGGEAMIDDGRDRHRPKPSGAEQEVEKLKKENTQLRETITTMTKEHSHELEALITQHNQQLLARLGGAAQRRAEKIAINPSAGRGRGLGLPPMEPKHKPVK